MTLSRRFWGIIRLRTAWPMLLSRRHRDLPFLSPSFGAATRAGKAPDGHKPVDDAKDNPSNQRESQSVRGIQPDDPKPGISHLVRLIDLQGNLVGDLSTEEAKMRASVAGLRLKEVNRAHNPPIVRLFPTLPPQSQPLPLRTKSIGPSPSPAKSVILKEVRISPTIAAHDLAFKVKKALAFLEDGCHVKIFMTFRRGQSSLRSEARDLMDKVAGMLMEGDPSGTVRVTIGGDATSESPLQLIAQPGKKIMK